MISRSHGDAFSFVKKKPLFVINIKQDYSSPWCSLPTYFIVIYYLFNRIRTYQNINTKFVLNNNMRTCELNHMQPYMFMYTLVTSLSLNLYYDVAYKNEESQ